MPPETWRKRGFLIVFISFSEAGSHTAGRAGLKLTMEDTKSLICVAMLLPSPPGAGITDVSRYTKLEALEAVMHPMPRTNPESRYCYLSS